MKPSIVFLAFKYKSVLGKKLKINYQKHQLINLKDLI